MTDLQACFFCGSPDDVRVVPLLPSGGPDAAEGEDPSGGPGADPGTVPLCPPCATKLERVVDRVLTAVDAGSGTDGPSPADRASGGPEASADRSSGGSGAGTGTEDGPKSTHEEDRPGITFGGAGSAGDDGATEPEANADPDRDRDGVAGEPHSDPDRDQQPDSTSDSTPDPPIDDRPDDGDGRPIGSVAPDGEDRAPVEGGPDGAAGVEPSSAAEGTGEEREPVDLDPLTTRRVLRLLQNREFPLEVDAFVDVAATAYELEGATVEAVIELAVDRGLLRREGDRLLKPRPDPGGGSGAADSDADPDPDADRDADPGADGSGEAGGPTDDSDT